MNSSPLVSVIICTHNRAVFLARCLSALLDRSSVSIFWEVVIVANGCKDNTVETVKTLAKTAKVPVRVLDEAAPGLSRARNVGAIASQGTYLVYLDDDAIPTEGWLAAYVEYFQAHPGICAGGGPIDLDWNNTQKPSFWQPDFGVHFGRLILPDGMECFPPQCHPFGGNFFITKAAFNKYGQFRESLGMQGRKLGLAEETEWLSRCSRDDNHIGYVQKALVFHWVDPDRLRPSALRQRAWHSGVVSVQIPDRPPEHRGFLAWIRQALSTAIHGRLSLPEQLYLLYWLGTLWAQKNPFIKTRATKP